MTFVRSFLWELSFLGYNIILNRRCSNHRCIARVRRKPTLASKSYTVTGRFAPMLEAVGKLSSEVRSKVWWQSLRRICSEGELKVRRSFE